MKFVYIKNGSFEKSFYNRFWKLVSLLFEVFSYLNEINLLEELCVIEYRVFKIW